MSLSDVTLLVQSGVLILMTVGLYLTWYSIKLTRKSLEQSMAQKRADLVMSIYHQFKQNPEVVNIYYHIEYGEFEYNEDFHQSPTEQHLDALLNLFDAIAKLWKMRILHLDDVKILGYEILVVYQDSEVQKYFKFLDRWFQERGINLTPFGNLRELGRKLEKEITPHKC